MKARNTETPFRSQPKAGSSPLRLTVDGLNSRAEGVCRHEGRVVFVPGALPGETVEARLQKSSAAHATARLLRVLEASDVRRSPPCEVYGACGGCSCQHMSYAAALDFKRDIVRDCFQRIGGLSFPVSEVLAMDRPWRYRNKAAMPVRTVDGRAAAGFFMRGSHRIVPVKDCLISMPGIDQAVGTVLAWMEQEGVQAYDEVSGTGIVRHVLARVSQTGDVMVTLAVNCSKLPRAGSLASLLRATVPGLVSLNMTKNLRRDNVILGDSSETLWGAASMEDRLHDLQFSVSPLSFFQVNPFQAEALYDRALALLEPEGWEVAADVYCGTGAFSLLLARTVRRVVGIEISADAVRDAQRNAVVNHIGNADFMKGSAEEVLLRLVLQGLRPDIIVVDPPRKGLGDPVLDTIAKASPQKILYISCHPATQARDARRLVESGYRISALCPVDMFCQTAHVENILLMTREPQP